MFKKFKSAYEDLKFKCSNKDEPIKTLVKLYKENPNRFLLVNAESIQELRCDKYPPRWVRGEIRFDYVVVLKDTITDIEIQLCIKETISRTSSNNVDPSQCYSCSIGYYRVSDDEQSVSEQVAPITELINSRIDRINRVYEWKRNSWAREAKRYDVLNEKERLKLLEVYGVK